MFRFVPSALFLLLCSAVSPTYAAILFESGTLGPTGITDEDVFNQVVPAGNVSSFSFVGARFHVETYAKVTRVGGHFVLAPEATNDSFFAALVRLQHSTDFPDSADLSTSDVVATTILDFPHLSEEVLGELSATVEPGWYAVVFGSGFFNAKGIGAALRNNTGIDDPDHIGFLSGFGWGDRPEDLYFRVLGDVIPEPSGFVLLCCSLVAHVCHRSRLTIVIS